MRRYQELAVGKGVLQGRNDSALPAGMKMQVDFIDQDDALAAERVFRGRIRYRHSPRQVSDHRQSALLSVGKLVDDQLFFLFEYYHPQRIPLYRETTEPRKKLCDCPSYRLQLTITVRRVIQTLLVLQVLTIPEPFEERPEVSPISRQRLVVSCKLIEWMPVSDTQRNIHYCPIDGIIDHDR